MGTQIGNPVIGERFVDADELICPGCGEQVRCAPPAAGLCDRGDDTTISTARRRRGARPQFSHRDATPLCRRVGGRAVEPIEQAGAP